MKKIYYSILWVCIFASCSNETVEITNQYIINQHWNKKNEEASANSITINKMKIKKDSTINPFSDLSQADILNKLEEDPSFMHYANIKIKQVESYKDKKIYFNQDNGFYWGSKSRHNSDDKAKTIGVLQPNNWYKFSDLGSIGLSNIYIYIDSANNVHRFNIMSANW